jgi:ATP-dependent Clp protease protease subunit
MTKFWNWKDQTETEDRTLTIGGTIAEDSWFDDEVTPKIFKDELDSGNGNVTVWINSPGGDCIAAAQIYNMLTNYSGKVTVKVDGIAASAASVIAMAGDKVLMSPVSVLMIHNPLTMVCGDHTEMQKAIDMLAEVKESIINAYEYKTGLSRAKLSHLMESETWMNANKAIELGFADGIIEKDDAQNAIPINDSVMFSQKAVSNALMNKLSAKYKPSAEKQAEIQVPTGHSVDTIMERLSNIKKYI